MKASMKQNLNTVYFLRCIKNIVSNIHKTEIFIVETGGIIVIPISINSHTNFNHNKNYALNVIPAHSS